MVFELLISGPFLPEIKHHTLLHHSCHALFVSCVGVVRATNFSLGNLRTFILYNFELKIC